MTINQQRKLFLSLTADERAWMVSRDNPDCPFSRFVGNDKAIKRLSRAAFVALGREDHRCADQSFALIGPSSTGKTTLAKMYAEVVQLPFVEIQADTVKETADIVLQVSAVLENTILTGVNGKRSLELVPVYELDGPDEPNHYRFPPMIIFIDEVHRLNKKVSQGLLQATEKNDGILKVEFGDEIATFNCVDVCWIIATTEFGMLFPPFANRFTTIGLELYSRNEVAEIIQINNPTWGMSVCKIVASYVGKVPREALAFAREMKIESEMRPAPWPEIAKIVADDNNIDEFGMTKQRLNILNALANGPLSKANACLFACCQEEELVKYTMPPLLTGTADDPALVMVTPRGYAITETGLKQLEMRKNGK